MLTFVPLILITALAFSRNVSNNAAIPGELCIDPPTLKCLSFRWQIAGDDNGNATVTASYRKWGQSQWREALPFLRVNREIVGGGYRCGNLLAGSIFNLQPNTLYEVRLRLSDPDGGSAEKAVTAETRAAPVL